MFETIIPRVLTTDAISRQHKCRDFEALKNWVVKHQIYTTEEHGIERLTGYQELDVPP